MSIDALTGSPAVGRSAVARLHRWQLDELAAQAATKFGGAPTLVGEVGIPFDVDKRALYALPVARPTDAVQTTEPAADAAMRHTVDVLEACGLSYTYVCPPFFLASVFAYRLWCYEAAHDDDALGDTWNLEDLSIYSKRPRAVYVARDRDPAGVHFGGRAVAAFSRPFARRVGGEPARAPTFDARTGTYRLAFRSDAKRGTGPTEVFVPAAVHYADGFLVDVSDGDYDVERAPPDDGGYAIVRYRPADRDVHAITIRRPPPPPGGRCCCPGGAACDDARADDRDGPAAPGAPLAMHPA